MANPRNPLWTRDEIIIVLHFYISYAPSIPSKDSQEILEVSQLLRGLRSKLGGTTPEKFRNPNSVYMRLMNFCYLDPNHTSKGLAHGNKLDQEIWDLYRDDHEELEKVAGAIRSLVVSDKPLTIEDAIAIEEEDAQEGKLLAGIHRYRERDRSLATRKKRQAMNKQGFLACEACEFDFGTFYGEVGQGYMECHHTKPLSEMPIEGETTKLSDLALLCSNCHRMIHRIRPWPTIDEFRCLIGSDH